MTKMNKYERVGKAYFVRFCPRTGQFQIQEKENNTISSTGDLTQIVSFCSLLELPQTSCEGIEEGDAFPALLSNASHYLAPPRIAPFIGSMEPLACFPNSLFGAYYVPPEYFIQAPAKLTQKEISLVGIGGLALDILRQSGARFGETIAVAGLGLVGNLVCQLGNVAGLNVIGVDKNVVSLEAAKKSGIKTIDISSPQWVFDLKNMLEDRPVDIFINCFTWVDSNFEHSILSILRKRATVMFTSTVMSAAFLEAEAGKLCLCKKYVQPYMSMESSYFPYSYVRWSVKRNMEQFAEMLKEGKILTGPILSESVRIDKLRDLMDFKLSSTTDAGSLELNIRFP